MTDNIHHLHAHRMVALPVKTLDQIVRDHGAEAQHREPMRFVPSQERKPSTFDKISDALSSPHMFTFYLGFYAGCMATVGLAFLWSVFQ